MKNAEVKFQFVTPCIMSGADQRKAEFRAPSVRGNLRWWMRALGCSKELVNALFGCANGDHGMRSRVIVRDTTTGVVPSLLQNAEGLTGRKTPDYFLWPLRPTKDSDSKRGVIPVNTQVSFSITVRGGVDSPELERALKAFLLFGALGTRSRRCYGSIWPTEVVIDGQNRPIPRTKADFKNAIADLKLPSELIVPTIVTQYGNNTSGVYKVYPDYASAIRECSNFLADYRRGKYDERSDKDPSSYGENDHDAPWIRNRCTCVYRATLGLPLTQKYSSSRATVTSSIDGYERLASPLHFKVVRLDGGFVPLAIFFPKMVPPNGTLVRLSGGEVRGLPLNTKIINDIKNDDQLIKIQ